MAVKGNIFEEHMIDVLLEIMQAMYESVSMPNAELTEALEFLKFVYNLNGNRFDIPKL